MRNAAVVVGALSAALAFSSPGYAVPAHLAIGADASWSDDGWGGGASKSDLVDGLGSHHDTWAHGLAAPWHASGDFHVVLDFGTPLTFNQVVAWWHGDAAYGANVVSLQTWSPSLATWQTVYSTSNALATLGPPDDLTTWTSSPTAFSFSSVTSDKLRLVYDNTEIYQRTGLHGWLYEVAVYNDHSVPEPSTAALLGLSLLGLGYVGRRRF